MKVKGIYRTLVSSLFILILAGCGGDDDDFGGADSLENLLSQNSWRSNVNYDVMEWGDDVSLSREIVTLYFVDEEQGVMRSTMHEDDSYFGSSSAESIEQFYYSVSGNNVRIDGEEFRYADGMLLPEDDGFPYYYTRSSLTSSEREWIETMKLQLLPSNERLDFEFTHDCEEWASYTEGGRTETSIILSVGVEAAAKVYSRGVTVITATYRIRGGTFSVRPETNLFISADENCSASSSTTVTTSGSNRATITATFTAYDHLFERDVEIGTATYTVPSK